MSHPSHAPRGVSFCKSKCSGRYRLESRDLLSSRCIAALFLAKKWNYPIGSFSREVKVEAITSCREECHMSKALDELSAIGVMGLDN